MGRTYRNTVGLCCLRSPLPWGSQAGGAGWGGGGREVGRALAAGPLGRGLPSPLRTNAWFLQPGAVAVWEGRGRHKVQGRSRVKGRRPGSQTGLPGPQSAQRRGEIIINRPGLCFSATHGLNLCFGDSRIILSKVNTQADKSGRQPLPLHASRHGNARPAVRARDTGGKEHSFSCSPGFHPAAWSQEAPGRPHRFLQVFYDLRSAPEAVHSTGLSISQDRGPPVPDPGPQHC